MGKPHIVGLVFYEHPPSSYAKATLNNPRPDVSNLGQEGSFMTADNRRRKILRIPHQFLLKLAQNHEKGEYLRECCKMPERVVIRHYKQPHKAA